MLLSHSKLENVKQALKDANWKPTRHEYEALINQKLWDLVSLPAGKKVVGYKRMFRVKENVDGSINKYKARLVTKVFH